MPAIEFTYVPPYGDNYHNLEGIVYCVDPADYMVAVYIYVSGWWTKPTWASPLTPIRSDGTWTCDITTGGNDPYATRIAAFLVPKGYIPTSMSGGPELPQELYDHSVAFKIVDRPPTGKTISFAGQTWYVKDAEWKADPGPCYYSDDPSDVWVDGSGRLHLKIVYRNYHWYCTEVWSQQTVGYGTYTFVLASPVDQLDRNAVLGLFTYDNTSSAYAHREIDIEFSRWGVASGPNAQYVVQPYTSPGHRYQFNLTLPGQYSTHQFNWQPGRVDFASYAGNQSPPDPAYQLSAYNHVDSDVPPPGQGNARINLWLFNGAAPSNGQEIEVVVSAFSFVSGP